MTAFRGAFRAMVLFTPLLLFAAILALPHNSARLSLMLHGHPFAKVVPKSSADIFQIVPTDNFACRALVFSHRKPIGWIMLPSTGGFESFIPFTEKPNLREVTPDTLLFQLFLTLAWACRWWLLLFQVLMLAFWLRLCRKKHLAR